MRPAGEIRQALLASARELFTQDRAPTMAELAHHAQVGKQAARRTVENMHRHGALRKVRDRRVPYRNKPVAEYAPPDLLDEQPGGVCLSDVVSAWAS